MVSFLPQDLPDVEPPKGGLHLLEQRLMQMQVVLDSLKEWCANEQAQQAAPQPYIHTSEPQPGSPYVPPDAPPPTPPPGSGFVPAFSGKPPATVKQRNYITGLLKQCRAKQIGVETPYGPPSDWDMDMGEAGTVINKLKELLNA